MQMLTRNSVLATIIFLVAVVVGTLLAQNTSATMLKNIGELLRPLRPTSNVSPLLLSIAFFFIIFINNSVKALGTIFFGILWGLPSLLFIVINGVIIGGLFSAVKSLNGWEYALAGIVPHGVIEIPMMLLATALGFLVGGESLKWLMRKESQIKSQLSASLKIYLRWILPGLAVAALIEAFVTPLILQLVAAK
jgi:stage II sporulation protein M